MAFLKNLTPFTLPLLLAACGNDDVDPNAINTPDIYEFSSQTVPSMASSVDYKEATTRLILINELKHLIGSDYLQSYGKDKTKVQVINLLNRLYLTGTKSGDNNLANFNLYDLHDPDDAEEPGATPIKGIAIESELPLLQSSFANLAANVNLKDKMPGIVSDLIYKDSEDNADFIGWQITGIFDDNALPDEMIQQWFDIIGELAADGDDNTKFIKNGIDYQQLVSTFLLGAISYGQATNQHLYINAESNNASDANDDGYTPLQHHWDLAFGYYGAAKHLGQLTQTQIIEKPDHNFVNDSIDLYSEYNFDFPINAALRDQAMILADTDYSGITNTAFLTGRHIIQSNFQEMDMDYSSYASTIVENWELSLTATILHYLNKTRVDLAVYQIYPILFDDYAYSWSTLKGLSLALQFNPQSKLSYEQLNDFQNKLKTTPKIYNDPETKPQSEAGRITDYSADIYQALPIFSDILFPGRNTRDW